MRNDGFLKSSIAEMSMLYSFVAVIVFWFLGLLFLGIVGVSSLDNPVWGWFLIISVPCISYLVWRWFTLIRIIRSWPEPRFGINNYKILQIGLFMITTVMLFYRGDMSSEKIDTLAKVLLTVDAFIIVSILVFFPLCWHARCKIPKEIRASLIWTIALIGIQFALIILEWRN